jgi:transglutaminase-like putative cysteine protease
MTARPVTGGWRIDRRTFLKALGLSGAALAAGARLPLPSFGADAAAAAPSRIDELALTLEFDAERIFRFVSDQIRYEPYAGVLRGAEGTLMARAGNAADQATLLAALLKASGIECRFAQGAIDAATADTLLVSAITDVETASRQYAEALTGSGDGGRPIIYPEPDERAVALLEEGSTRTAETLDWANKQLAAMVSTVETALASAGITLPPGFATLPSLETDGHVWVQAASGPVWLDLDPSVPDTPFGDAVAAANVTHDVLPDDLRHRLRLEVIAETASGGALREESTLQVDDFADVLSGQSIGFLNLEREGLKALGGTIISTLEGGTTYVPCLVVGESVLLGTGAIRFGGGGNGPFDVLAAESPSPRDGEPTAQWLQITIASPGQEDRVVRRAVFDRLGTAARSTGALGLDALEPAELVQVRPGKRPDYMPARRTHWLTVHSGPWGGSDVGDAFARTDKASSLANLPRSLQLYREAAGIELGVPSGVRTFVDGPDIAGVTVDQSLVAEDEVRSRLALDIWHRSLGTLPMSDTEATVAPTVVAGALPHLVERLMAGESAHQADRVERGITSVGAVFDAAASEGVGAIVLRTADEVDALPYSSDARARLNAALASGLVAIAPERPPSGPDGRVGWWLVDPASGRTVDEMDDGRGTVDQYAVTVRVTTVEAAGPMEDLGLCVAIIFLTALGALLTVGAFAGTAVAASRGNGVAAGLLGVSAVTGSGTLGGIVGGEAAGASLVSC